MSKASEAEHLGGTPSWLTPWIHWRFKRFWALLALLSYTLAGFFLAPWLVERTLVNTFAETGRTAQVTTVRTNPFLLTLDMLGFQLRDADEALLLEFDRFFIDFQASSLFRWAWTFKAIEIAGLHGYEERFEGSDTRFVRLLSDLAGPEAPENEEDTGPPPRAILRRVAITEARLGVIDRTADDFQTEFGPIEIVVEDVRTVPGHAGDQAVVVQLDGSNTLEWQGDLQLVPFRSSGRLRLDAGALPVTGEYLEHLLPFDPLFDGIDVNFDYALGTENEEFFLRLTELTASVRGIELVMDGSGAVPVGLASLEVRGGQLDLLERRLTLEGIDALGLSLEAALREDGSVSLVDLVPPGAGATGAKPADAEEPWSVGVAKLNLIDGRVALEDRTVNPVLAVDLAPVEAELTGIDLADGTVIPLTASATLSSGGQWRYDGGVTLFPAFATQGELALEGVAVAVAQSYLNPFLRVSLEGGVLDLTGDLAHGPDQVLALAGGLQLMDFEVSDSVRDERLAAWKKLELDRFELDLSGTRAETSVLEFEGLYGRLHISEDLTTNVGDLLVDQGTNDSTGEDAEALALTIGGVALVDAALDFSDFSLPLPFEAAIRDLDGDVSTLSTNSSTPAEVGLEGQVNEYGLARINGTINAWDPTQLTDIALVFRNLEIARLSPYTIQFAGYAIEEGRLDMDLGYVLDDRILKGDNSIVIREIRLGEKVDHPDAGSLPLGLAVALLKDSEGVIDIDLPVEGDLDNPEFRIGGVIWQAIGNLITRVVTAPFRFLGNLVGVDSEDFGVMAFQPGSAEISPPDREKLVKLGEAMLKRPELIMEVSGVWAPGPDRRALQEARLDERLSSWLEANPGSGEELSAVRDQRALEALHAETFPGEDLAALRAGFSAPPPGEPEAEPVLDRTTYLADLRERLVQATDVGDDALASLARSRAEAVATTLQEGQPETELNVRTVEPGSVEATEDGTVPLELAVSAEN